MKYYSSFKLVLVFALAALSTAAAGRTLERGSSSDQLDIQPEGVDVASQEGRDLKWYHGGHPVKVVYHKPKYVHHPKYVYVKKIVPVHGHHGHHKVVYVKKIVHHGQHVVKVVTPHVPPPKHNVIYVRKQPHDKYWHVVHH